MKTSNYQNIMASLDFKNRINAVLIIALLVTNVILAVNLVSARNNQMVIIQPVGMTATYQIGKETATEEYLLAMANHITYLYLNFDGTTVSGQYKLLSDLSSDVLYTTYQTLAEDYRRNGVSSRAQVKKIDLTDKEIIISGNRTKYVMDKMMEDKAFKLTIRYKIEGGRFRVLDIGLT